MPANTHRIDLRVPVHCTRLVVVSELPVARDTLLVRLFGAGSVLKHAIAELQALRERKLLLRMLRRRVGAEVDGEIERRIAAAPPEQIEVWAEPRG